jgi:threonine dehydrogenase-like Zn-dependent dehydrogenase
MPGILDGTLQPGKVFDTRTDLDGVPAGYRGMADRKHLKVLITPETFGTPAYGVETRPP